MYSRRSTSIALARAIFPAGTKGVQLDALARQSRWWNGHAIEPERLLEAGLDPGQLQVRQLLALTSTLIGFPRHLSQHTGGFVLTQLPLSRLVPIENAAMADRTVIEWDKDDLDAMGLLKVDVLALGMLSALRRALDMLASQPGTLTGLDLQHPHAWSDTGRLTLAAIPKDDPATYRMAADADTVGVFQIESRAQMSMLPRLRPAVFYDLVVQVAIVDDDVVGEGQAVVQAVVAIHLFALVEGTFALVQMKLTK